MIKAGGLAKDAGLHRRRVDPRPLRRSEDEERCGEDDRDFHGDHDGHVTGKPMPEHEASSPLRPKAL